MKRILIFLFLVICLGLVGCDLKPRSSSESNDCPYEKDSSFFKNHDFSIENDIRYATGFSVIKRDGLVCVEVKDPWNKEQLLQRYLLVSRDKPIPTGLPSGTVIRVPLRKMVVYSAVHAAMFDTLGALDEIAGVCEGRYIKSPNIKTRIKNGSLQDLGNSTSPNIEKMIALGTEVIIASPFEHGSYGAVEKTAIPVIECADYMETNPLGRAEWIKFIGLLTGEVDRADSLFKSTESNYLRLKGLTENVAYRPKLMTEMKYGNSWYVSGGESYMAHLYKDSGADYLFDYLSGAGGIPLSFETVLQKAIHADLWMILYNREDEMTYSALQSDFSSNSRFDPFLHRRIFGCNVNYSLYYEEVPMQPDLLLSELIAIFHPTLQPDHKLQYFKPLKE